MVKKVLTGLMVLLFVGVVFAPIQEGNIYSQAQVNSIDPVTVNLHCSYDGWGFKTRLGIPFFYAVFNFSCLSIKHTLDENFAENESEYIVFVKSIQVFFKTQRAIACILEGNSFAECKQGFIQPTVISKFKSEKAQIRNRIDSFQTTPDISVEDWGLIIDENTLGG